MTMLNHHKELTARLRSARYLHVVREYNSAADSLAGETLETRVSKVVLSTDRKTELSSLNRIPEVIYEAPTGDNDELNQTTGNFVQTLDAEVMSERKTFVDFVRPEQGEVSVVTRRQSKAREKRVRFADEVSTEPPTDANPPTEPTEAPTRSSRRKSRRRPTQLPTPSSNDIDPVAVQEERRRRIRQGQDEELRWSNLKAVLGGEESTLGYRAARDAWKLADKFVLTDDGLLYYMGFRRHGGDGQRAETHLRLVVPTTMIQEVLQNYHDSLEGGHQGVVRTYQRVKLDYYWLGLYADVEKHVKSCPDCSSSKSRPQLRGYSPGNVLAERPFQIVSMDFVIPLPKSRRGNTALLLFQCSFTGFVIAKAMSDTTALTVAQAFEECIYRRFGAPSLIRHDRDPRFMSEVFQAFTEMMQSRSRATLSYRPQANGQQERSVKTVMQTIKVYVEDPLQQDWDEIVERLVFAINTSLDTTRKETPFYLVHGWDAHSTLQAMTTSLRRGTGKQSDALTWRREVNRQQEIALEMAKQYQATEKARRAREHNETLSRRERAAVPQTPEGATSDTHESTANDESESATRSLFEPGSHVALHGASEARLDEETCSSMARAVPSQTKGRGVYLRAGIARPQRIPLLSYRARFAPESSE
ncbi:hypothetical protein PF003_g13543 [Phytophthora fragariae]|nr:hypothetical protein PF003_g13543 [Phytophthora fragariae]